jgi:anti-sigma B factor antagonist
VREDASVLQCSVESEPAATVVHVAGEIDLDSEPDLRDLVMRALLGESPVVVDLSEVSFIDSAGLRLLVDAHAEAAAKRLSLRIVEGQGRVRRVLEIAGLREHLAVFPTVAAALRP